MPYHVPGLPLIARSPGRELGPSIFAVSRSHAREAQKVWDHKVYYPGAHELLIRVTGDRGSGRLPGAQIVGHWQAEVAKRIDSFATALFHGMQIEDLNDLDLSYAPPLGSPWDTVQTSAQQWSRAIARSA